MRPLPLNRLPRAAWTLAVSFAGEWDKDGRDLVPPGWRPRIAAATVGLYALSLLVIPGAHQSKDGRVVAVLRRQERRANLLIGLRAAAVGSPLLVAIALDPSRLAPACLALLALVVGARVVGMEDLETVPARRPEGVTHRATRDLVALVGRMPTRGPRSLHAVPGPRARAPARQAWGHGRCRGRQYRDREGLRRHRLRPRR